MWWWFYLCFLCSYTLSQQVHSIFPIGTPIGQRVLLKINGNNFEKLKLTNQDMYCQFYSDRLPIQQNTKIQFISNETILCDTPRTRIILNYEITILGRISLTLNESFLIYPRVDSVSLNPRMGSLKGGIQILLRLRRVIQDSLRNHLKCKFGNKEMNATLLTVLEIQCMVPSSLEEKNVTFQISQNGGVSYENVGQSFYYFNPPWIYSLEPNVGSMLGGDTIFVNGSNFKEYQQMVRHSFLTRDRSVNLERK
jgi:hypothetical protein